MLPSRAGVEGSVILDHLGVVHELIDNWFCFDLFVGSKADVPFQSIQSRSFQRIWTYFALRFGRRIDSLRLFFDGRVLGNNNIVR